MRENACKCGKMRENALLHSNNIRYFVDLSRGVSKQFFGSCSSNSSTVAHLSCSVLGKPRGGMRERVDAGCGMRDDKF